MAEYDLEFATKLAETADLLVNDGLEYLDAQRTVLYLSLLSCEISLKALLEQAGFSVARIRRRSHNLRKLLADLGNECEVEVILSENTRRWCPATEIRAEVADDRFTNATVGTVLDAEEFEASAYPNEIRYGEKLRHYPADIVASAARVLNTWAIANWSTIRVRK